jgi:hypothetical protein
MGLKCVAVGKLGPSMTVHGDKALIEIGCEDLRGGGRLRGYALLKETYGIKFATHKIGFGGGGGRG